MTKKLIMSYGLRVFVLLASMVSLQAVASNADEVRVFIEENTERLVERLNEERGFYQTDPERFYREMDAELSEVIDFYRISVRIMGKYARQASTQQREAFTSKFKRSLYEAYSKALVESGSFSMSVTGAQLHSRSDERATVDLEVVTASGNRYPIVYSMYMKGDKGWLLENVIVNGVNVGLAFRDRFEQEMREQGGDMDTVIGGWTARVDTTGGAQ